MTSTRPPRSHLTGTRHPGPRPGRSLPGRPAAWLLLVGLAVSVAGCAQGGPEPDAALSGAAIDACLGAAATHQDFPADGPAAVTVSAEPDDQGWWAVTAQVEVDGTTQVLTCTAVPDEDGVVRAASWSTSEE